MLYRTDYHIHSLYSDGKAEPEEYIKAAINAGLSEIGFSEHVNLSFTDHYCMDPGRIHDYINHLGRLKKEEKRIQIKTGLEVDYIPGTEDETVKFLQELELDFVIGSVHKTLQKSVDSDPDLFTENETDNVFSAYFSLVSEAAASGLFDIIGHCDYIRMFNHRPTFDPEPLYIEIVSAMSRHDVAFELNTNGRNRPLGDFYPDRRFLKLFYEFNVPVCVNSDSHSPSKVGQYFGEAYSLLKAAGYTAMAAFDRRERYQVPAQF